MGRAKNGEHICTLGTWEGEAGGSLAIGSQPGIQQANLSQGGWGWHNTEVLTCRFFTGKEKERGGRREGRREEEKSLGKLKEKLSHM